MKNPNTIHRRQFHIPSVYQQIRKRIPLQLIEKVRIIWNELRLLKSLKRKKTLTQFGYLKMVTGAKNSSGMLLASSGKAQGQGR